MLRYLLQRLGRGILTIFVSVTLVFFIIRAMPSDPVALMISPQMTPETQQALMQTYGLDKPIGTQYVLYMKELLHGNMGTSFWGPIPLFRKWGFPVKVSARPGEFDAMAKEADACILFYRWRKKWKLGAHFVALRYLNGSFLGYNTYRNSTGPDRYGPSLQAFLKERGYFGTVLIGIHKK